MPNNSKEFLFFSYICFCLTNFNQRFLPQLGVFAQKHLPNFQQTSVGFAPIWSHQTTVILWEIPRNAVPGNAPVEWVISLGEPWHQAFLGLNFKWQVLKEVWEKKLSQGKDTSGEEVCANISLFQENLNRCSMLRCVQFSSKCRDEYKSLPAIYDSTASQYANIIYIMNILVLPKHPISFLYLSKHPGGSTGQLWSTLATWNQLRSSTSAPINGKGANLFRVKSTSMRPDLVSDLWDFCVFFFAGLVWWEGRILRFFLGGRNLSK